MIRRTLSLTLIVIAALALPVAPAQADEFPTDRPLDTPLTRAYVQAAIAFWGVNPCPEGIQVFESSLSSAGSGGGAAARTSADPAHRCQMILGPLYGRDYDAKIRQCSAAGHEVGHWLGHEHTDDLRSVMFGGKIYADGSYGNLPTVKSCYKRFKPKRVSPRRDRALNGERIWAQRPATR